ncbi:MAG: hypothetical protein UE295_09975 [Acutalibacteraceae bacterium]|nr:hypothetical protein [Acutalibacteraceae bacterium]
MNYVLSSPFAELDEVMVNGISDNDYYQMVQDFYSVQEPYPVLKSHRRIFHMILSMRHCKNMHFISQQSYIQWNYCYHS